MNIVFIGDSLASGENNNFKGYPYYYKVNHPEHHVDIFGVSGSCMGDYSIYPVKENMYDEVYELSYHTPIIENADIIFLQYGINDTTALTIGYANFIQVCISIVKTVDMIKQVNNDVRIVFLVPFDKDSKSLQKFASLHIDYLIYDYLRNYSIHSLSVDIDKWLSCYKELLGFIENSFEVHYLDKHNIYMSNIDEDNIHLTSLGYKKVAEYIDEFI